jgi:hypothetical protein
VAFSWFGFRRKMKSGARRASSMDLAKLLSFKPRMETLEDRLTPTAGVSVLQFHITPPPGAPTFAFGGVDYITTMPTTGASTVTITVDRTTDPGDTVALNTAVSAQYATTDETAMAGTNYTETDGTITIPAGQTSATFTVPILNVPTQPGGALVGNTVFGIGLSNPSAEATINPQADATAVSIKDSSGTQNERYVNDVFQELLDRPADPGALQSFGGELAAGTAKGVVLLQIETSVNASGRNEYNDNTVNNLFQQFLGRNADLGALNFYGSQLTSGAGIQQLQAEIIGSDEYFTNAGATNPGWISAMYRDLVNRNPDAGGAAFYLNLINQTSQQNPTEPQSAVRSSVATNFLGQTEPIQDELTTFYSIYLNRNADPSGLAFYTQQLQSSVPLQTVINEFLGSTNEYFNQV